jgi:AraC-like DNA-binding protein
LSLIPHDRSVSPHPQPIAGYRDTQLLHGIQEEIEYLPGTSVRIWYTHLNTGFPPHWHNALEIVEGENEQYTVEADGNVYHVRPNDILFIPGGITHTLTPSENCNGFVYLINLDFLSMIKSASRIMPLLSHPLYISESEKLALYISVSTLLRQIRTIYFSDDSLRELLIYSNLLVLMARLIDDTYYNADNMHSRSYKRLEYNNRFSEVINYINHNYTEDLTVDETARRFGLSKFYFSRLFQKYIHYTFSDYLAFRRLKAAEQLLSEPEFTITDIAFRSGFSNLSTFSRVFRKYKNCTPTEYRQAHTKANQAYHK